MGCLERGHLVTGIGMASASGTTVVPPAPLVASITFNGSTSTPVHYSVTHYDGDTITDFAAQFGLSSTGGVGAVALSYDITANTGQGYCSNQAHTLFGQAGTNIATAQAMAMAWGINGGTLNVGDSADVTVRCKAVDSLSTVAFSSGIKVSVTRTV